MKRPYHRMRRLQDCIIQIISHEYIIVNVKVSNY